MSAKPKAGPSTKTQRGELVLNAAKVGALTLRDLADFAEQQGCELRVKFVRPAGHAKAQQRMARTAKALAAGLQGA